MVLLVPITRFFISCLLTAKQRLGLWVNIAQMSQPCSLNMDLFDELVSRLIYRHPCAFEQSKPDSPLLFAKEISTSKWGLSEIFFPQATHRGSEIPRFVWVLLGERLHVVLNGGVQVV